MNRYKLSKAGINVSEGITRFGGNAEKYEQFLMKFKSDINFSLMCEAIAKGDAAAAFSSAHALKGIVGNLSLGRLYDDLFPLVELLRRGSLENAGELLASVTKDYEDVIAALTV
ncbi:MAG: Hpt domain-containing protein [Eubacteriales bacterium]|nr:Hpt domain-containing protein [Eubacteriales bacterium]MDD3882153.1 Hpt domain-containing protein [Eubacteriales bacterium]MDD4513258.1 Hpt domain-containing protein [Eubacteriales bacterium]